MLAYGSTMVFEERYHPYTCSTRPLVKLQPESPCPSPNSDISYGRSRSTTPETKPQIPDPRTSLPFSISNILKPDFGRTKPQPIYRPYDLVKPAERQQNQQQIRPDSANSSISTGSSTVSSSQEGATTSTDGSSNSAQLWPAWVYCTRYSDRPSSGPRSRRAKKCPKAIVEDKRPRTAFSGAQLGRLKNEFNENLYLTERRRQQLASELGLAEAQIKIWFQNKRAKIKKSSGQKNPLAIQLMAQGLYNHRTVTESEDEEEIHVT